MNIERGFTEENIIANDLYSATIIELVKTVENGITKDVLFDAVKEKISENRQETKISQLSRMLEELKSKDLIVENRGIIKISSSGKRGLFNLLDKKQIENILGTNKE